MGPHVLWLLCGAKRWKVLMRGHGVRMKKEGQLMIWYEHRKIKKEESGKRVEFSFRIQLLCIIHHAFAAASSFGCFFFSLLPNFLLHLSPSPVFPLTWIPPDCLSAWFLLPSIHSCSSIIFGWGAFVFTMIFQKGGISFIYDLMNCGCLINHPGERGDRDGRQCHKWNGKRDENRKPSGWCTMLDYEQWIIIEQVHQGFRDDH